MFLKQTRGRHIFTKDACFATNLKVEISYFLLWIAFNTEEGKMQGFCNAHRISMLGPMLGPMLGIGIPRWHSGKESACQCRRCRFDSWVREDPLSRKQEWLQYSCLDNPKRKGAWSTTVYRVTKSLTWLSKHADIWEPGEGNTNIPVDGRDLHRKQSWLSWLSDLLSCWMFTFPLRDQRHLWAGLAFEPLSELELIVFGSGL